MILVFLSLGNALRNITVFKTFQKDIAAKIFEEYRMALYDISRRNWSNIGNLSLGDPYYLYFDGTYWQIATGSTSVKIGLNQYQVYFYLNNFENDPEIKLVTTQAIFSSYVLQDIFLLPKTR